MVIYSLFSYLIDLFILFPLSSFLSLSLFLTCRHVFPFTSRIFSSYSFSLTFSSTLFLFSAAVSLSVFFSFSLPLSLSPLFFSFPLYFFSFPILLPSLLSFSSVSCYESQRRRIEYMLIVLKFPKGLELEDVVRIA